MNHFKNNKTNFKNFFHRSIQTISSIATTAIVSLLFFTMIMFSSRKAIRAYKNDNQRIKEYIFFGLNMILKSDLHKPENEFLLNWLKELINLDGQEQIIHIDSEIDIENEINKESIPIVINN